MAGIGISGYRGVTYDPRDGRWKARVRGTNLGKHNHAEVAAHKVDQFVVKNGITKWPLNNVPAITLELIAKSEQVETIMEAPNIRNTRGPEAVIQDEIMKYLRLRQWFVQRLHGNLYQSGVPDLFAAHKIHGMRFIEVKHTISFTPAQKLKFPEMAAAGVGIWVMQNANDHEYAKLFHEPNWAQYMYGNCPGEH